MKQFLFVLMLFAFIIVNGQVTFVVTELPESTPSEDGIYIVGNFNGWNPGDPNYLMSINNDGFWEIILEEQDEGSSIEYKFTRGSWLTVEKGANNEEIPNRTFTYGNGENVEVSILNWADDTGGSTAAWNVYIMDDSFYMPQLDRYRRIWIYLPPGYDTVGISYPVIYMHDGQNLFDAYTSYAGEWEIDETLNNLSAEGYQVPIVVGIDNGGIDRTEELTPWIHPTYGGGRGEDYMAFIAETLKPFIDENYSTLSDRDNTAIIGSSLGGLISTFGALTYQNVFSKSGPFSPAYWINYDSINLFIEETGKEEDIRFYQNIGELEGEQVIQEMFQIGDSLVKAGFEDFSSMVITGGEHNEATWRDDFENAYLWLFPSYATKVPEYEGYKPLFIFPNPVGNEISLDFQDPVEDFELIIFDSNGREVIHEKKCTIASINTSRLKPGMYVLIAKYYETSYSGRFVKN